MGWILIIAGGALAGWSAYEFWRGWASAHWPAADGEVVSSTVRERHGRGGPFYEPEIGYRYVVGGAEFTGRRLRFGGVRLAEHSPAAAYADLRSLDPGARIPVYYDPNNPHRSVLCPGYRREDIGFAAIGLTVIYAGTRG